mmetsp:Transcript_8390/g.17900  ORF Transcript_8390/g.17900 Transcript_8390/m.17900 type:complete len:91 (-) Transcript_8390:16-288(-)
MSQSDSTMESLGESQSERSKMEQVALTLEAAATILLAIVCRGVDKLHRMKSSRWSGDRCVTKKSGKLSLGFYYSIFVRFHCDDGGCAMVH